MQQLLIARGAADVLPQLIEWDVVRFAELHGKFIDTYDCVSVCVCVLVCVCVCVC